MKRVIAMVTTLGLAFALFVYSPVFASTNASLGTYKQSFVNTGLGATGFVAAQQLYPTNEYLYQNNSVSDDSVSTWTLLLTYSLANITDAPIAINQLYFNVSFSGLSVSGNPGTWFYKCVDIHNFSEDLMVGVDTNSGNFTLFPGTNWTRLGEMCIPAKTRITGVAAIEFPVQYLNGGYVYALLDGVSLSIGTVYPVTDGFTPVGSHQDITDEINALRSYLIGQNGLPLINSDLITINDTLTDIKDLLQELTDNLGSSDYSDTIDDSDDLQTTESQVHQQEQQWYADNQTAIEATGLGNYQYSPGLINSFGVARYQIAMLWNALGDWTYVYYLVFLLGLAVYILRHEPTMRVKQMRADREARMQENQIYTNASRNVRMSRDADYARHVAWGFKTRRR